MTANVTAMMRMTQATFVAFWTLFLVWGKPSLAQDTPNPQQLHYQDCMKLAHSHPETALENAKVWEGVGGGYPARHCKMAALTQLGQFAIAAKGFEDLAMEVNADKAFKVQLYLQSGEAWFSAGNAERTRQISETILLLQPENSEALLIRAKALGVLGTFWEAADDLTRVLYAKPGNVDVLVLRGSAYRQMGALDSALIDLNRVLTIDPSHPDALLERGLTHQASNNEATAQTDWQALIKAHPDSEASKHALRYLKALKAGQP